MQRFTSRWDHQQNEYNHLRQEYIVTPASDRETPIPASTAGNAFPVPSGATLQGPRDLQNPRWADICAHSSTETMRLEEEHRWYNSATPTPTAQQLQEGGEPKQPQVCFFLHSHFFHSSLQGILGVIPCIFFCFELHLPTPQFFCFLSL